MSTQTQAADEQGAAGRAQGDSDTLDAGTYEVLRGRMSTAATELARRSQLLNAQRMEAFGGSELELIGNDRIRTEHNCVPRDIVQVGGLMLFGYNVHFGLKQTTAVGDVFALRRHHEGRFEEVAASALPGLLDDPRFQRDFTDLYRYYQEAELLQLRRTGSLLLAVFQTSERLTDIRVLRWRIAPDGTPEYIDSKGERDHVFPPSHDFEWTPTGREDHISGRHPHISIEGELFVETVNGSLTVKIEDNTESGKGIYSEPVQEPLQSLADASVAYVRVGPLILLRVLPYKETDHRYLVFNQRSKEVVRLDGIGLACQRLPEDQGIIFPGGYYLTTAPAGSAARTFDTDTADLEFESVVRSPNGEDVLYVFHARAEGRTLLLPYNLIRKEVAAPIPSHGYSLFEDGTMAVFRAMSDEPTRVHPMQLWQTPYLSDAYAAAQPEGSGPLTRVGNAELVRGISDALSVARMADEMAPSVAVFEAIVAACGRVADTYYWLPDEGLHGLHEPLESLRGTAEQVIDEFERVEELRAQSTAALERTGTRVTTLVRRARGEAPGGATAWVTLLADLRRAQGGVESLRELRYVDVDQVDALSEQLTESLASTGRRAVAYLSREDAFDDTREAVEELTSKAGEAPTVADADPLGEQIGEHAEGLRVVTDVVGGLDIADATVRTDLLERIGEVMGVVNRARAVLDGRRKELLASEGRAEFAAEFALLGQAVAGALAASGTPEECDEQLGRLLLQLENLESRFGAFDDFLTQLTEQREEIYETFSARKQAQLDERARHAERLVESATRILGTITRRSGTLTTLDDVNAYFATDPLVAKIRDTAEELRGIGDSVRAEELDGRLKATRQEAARSLRDRADLYDAEGTVRLGRHRFGVNNQPIDLTLVPHDGALAFAVTGTDYRAPVTDPAFEGTRDFWEQPLVSEASDVYRAEYLAATVLAATDTARLREAAKTENGLTALVREHAEAAYDEGYDRGVHDHDAATILAVLLDLTEQADLLRFTPEVRSAAQLFWTYGTQEETRATWTTRARSLARARRAFGPGPAIAKLAGELAAAAEEFLTHARLTVSDREAMGSYLFEELASGQPGFATSAAAREILGDFRSALGGPRSDQAKEFTEDLQSLGEDLTARHQLALAWLSSFAQAKELPETDLPEAAVIELCGDAVDRREITASVQTTVTGLLGSHRRVRGGQLPLRLDEFLARTHHFRTHRVPAHRAYTRTRNALLTAERERLRLDAFKPQVMSAFVRNRLIDEVYLPLIGDNLAKQLGTAGDDRRTDSQGLLLLLSPPGYGKTTLMEYVASRLGLVLVKVDGPALGYHTTSLDPAAAPDAAARREIEKLNFALEMGNNVFLYLDDIQHTSPELLQKFIPLCDAQRRVDGVATADGTARTFDLRGKRFAVCMAGNPFTSTGARFRIPDMLANRADVWNLGDVLSGKEDVFALSHIENALTSNPVLAPLAARERGDIDLLVRLARGEPSAQADRLTHPYTPTDLEQILSVLRKLLYVQETSLKVNAAYILSATMDDSDRTEPPFRLQGSYRNTNKLAERIVPVMNQDELEALIDDHYLGEAQTLTAGAEANLLKLAELRGRLSQEQTARWAEIKHTYTASK